jgi:hypothetical protein
MAIIKGTSGNDTLVGTQFADILLGFAGNDLLLGKGGNDLLDGGKGIDTLNGGAGNDTYIIDNINDFIIEAVNGGYDTVKSSQSYTLTSNLERLELTGIAATNGTGNNLNNVIIGNNANNILRGGRGNDNLNGKAGVDIIYGGDGNDTLSGSDVDNNRYYFYTFGDRATDILYGGDGNDTYILAELDVIREEANAGIDTVTSYINYTLGDNLENLTLAEPLGDRNLSGTGNNLNNTIIGNSFKNVLRGLAGNDSLNGGAGADTLIGTDGTIDKDTLTGGRGRDTFILGTNNRVFYDDNNPTTPGFADYALITDLNFSEDQIRLNGKRSDYLLLNSPTGMPAGTAIFRQKSGEPNELIAIIQSSTTLNLIGTYFKFTDDEIDVSTSLNGCNGFTISSFGISSDYIFAAGSVSSAGDINGDGFADVLIGAPGANQFAGASYVVFGKPNEFSAKVNLTALNGNNGFVINGINALDFLGGVSSAGDVNGDGFADILLGAGGASPNGQTNAGESYIVFGTGGFGASLNLATLNGNNGFILEGINAFDGASTVSDAGDINGDGFADILIGARNADPNGQSSAGQSYVVFGTGEFNARVNLATLNGSNGFAINGIFPEDYSGASVSSAGDINGDGFADILIGAPGANEAGQSYVVFGKPGGFNAQVNLATLNGSNGFAINGIKLGDASGGSVSNAGDVNGDGFDDIIIGARGADPNNESGAGQSYVVFGKRGGFDASINLAALNGSNGFIINGINQYNYSGINVSSAGDVNGDGFDDLIIGTGSPYLSRDRVTANGVGESYVIFGKAGGFGASFDLSDLNGLNGFVLKGISTDNGSTTAVSSAGDVNGDGFDDLILGSSTLEESYVVFGRDFTNKVNRLGTPGDDLLIGTNGNDILIGGLGNDTLRGGRGSDVLYGGAGDDVLIFGPQNHRMDGGSGIDTLAIEVSNMTMDLTAIPRNRITGIEIIDLTGTGNNSLKLDRWNVLNLSDTKNQLIVKGNVGDRITSTQQGWLSGGTITLDGITYNQFTAGAATLLVDTEITQTIS